MTSMSLALSICVLFISMLLMQSVNEAQFLNITSLSLLPPPAANAATEQAHMHHYNPIKLILILNF